MGMEWLLIAVSMGLVLMNIRLMLIVKKQHINNSSPEIHEKMAQFVAQLEEENNELYNKLTTYIKNSETQLVERVERLEQTKIEQIDSPEKSTVETEKIIQLSRQGFSSRQIAKVLHADFGEVELVLNMNNKQYSNLKEEEVL
ncbi:DUF6115 domain-containing protein [Planococcus kocurii]|uniref:DUF6115 domain-containing protein n=1 Tax=Planococcus kocurii TaxID=1374 RepID=UPI003D080148